MAHLIRPFINASGFPSVQEMYRSTRHFLILLPTRSRRLVIQNALLMTSIYETHLHFDGLFDEMGKWNGYIFVFRFFWKPG